MATVVQIKGSDFSGKGLPVITPLLLNGLIGAFRPSKNLANTADLSQTNATVSLVGTPVFTDTYIECDYANGLSTNIQETASLTMAFVARTQFIDGVSASFLGGTYTGGRGLSFSRGTLNFNLQTFAKRTTDNTYQNLMSAIGVQKMETSELSAWGLWVASIDAINNKLLMYSSDGGFVEYDGTANNYNFADRDGLNRLFHIGKPVYNTATTYKAKTHIAEALFYNKALTREEIEKLYAISKQAMSLKDILI